MGATSREVVQSEAGSGRPFGGGHVPIVPWLGEVQPHGVVTSQPQDIRVALTSRFILTYHFNLARWRIQCHPASLHAHKNVAAQGLTESCRSRYRAWAPSVNRIGSRFPLCQLVATAVHTSRNMRSFQVRSCIWK